MGPPLCLSFEEHFPLPRAFERDGLLHSRPTQTMFQHKDSLMISATPMQYAAQVVLSFQ